jgi:RNA recognition motif-containing protein
MRLYVGNLPFQATDAAVRDFFERAGYSPDEIKLMRDRVSGEPRGFGFVEIGDQAAAERAIQTCNGKDFLGRAIVVNEAKPMESGGGSRRK